MLQWRKKYIVRVDLATYISTSHDIYRHGGRQQNGEEPLTYIPNHLSLMGRKSKASLACLRNLPKPPLRPILEDYYDSEDEEEDEEYCPDLCRPKVPGSPSKDRFQGIFLTAEDNSDIEDDLPDLDCFSDSDSALLEMQQDEDDTNIEDDAALLNFISVLQKAQEAAVHAERKRMGETKRPKQYTGNSSRTLRRHAQKRRRLAAEGQSFISEWTVKKERAEYKSQDVEMTDGSSKEPASLSHSVSHSILFSKMRTPDET